MKKIFIILVFLIVSFFTSSVFGAVYDTFEGPSIDTTVWEQGEVVREIVNGKLISKVSNNPQSLYERNTLPFPSQGCYSIEVKITVVEALLDTGDNASSIARSTSFFYNTQNSGNAKGDIAATIFIGDRGNGLESWYEVVELLANDLGNYETKGSATIIEPGILSYGTEYTVKMEYDGNHTFTFTVDGQSSSFEGPGRQRDNVVQVGTLITGVDSDNGPGKGHVHALFDDLTINGSLYDDFSSSLLDPGKWYDFEISREIVNKKLHFGIRGGTNSRIFMNPVSDEPINVMEAKITFEKTQLDVGTMWFGGFWYNDSKGPGSNLDYNGYEGNVYAAIKAVPNPNSYFELWALVSRTHDFDGSLMSSIFWQRITVISLDTEHVLSISFTGDKFVFKCDNLSTTYKPVTAIYPPYLGEFLGKFLQLGVDWRSGNFGHIDVSCDYMYMSDGTSGDVAPLGNRDGIVNVGDALVSLRFALTLETPTAEDIQHGDVAPLDAQNKPNPDGVINVGDALVILRKALGLISF